MKKKVPDLLGFIIFSAAAHIFLICVLSLHGGNVGSGKTMEVSLVEYHRNYQKNPAPERQSVNITPSLEEKTENPDNEQTKNEASDFNKNSLSGAQKDDFYMQYLVLIQNKIEKNRKYPAKAVANNQEGTSYVKFTILPNGDISEISLIKSSGYSDLDQTAIAMVQDANPLPSFPQKTPLSIKLPIIFKIKR